MTRRLIILGKGGNTLDILDAVESVNDMSSTWEVKGILDDASAAGTRFFDLNVLGPLGRARDFRGECLFLNAIGSDKSFRRRQEIISSTGLDPADFATVVHARAVVSSRARIGRGVCAGAGVCVAGGVTIGDHVWLGAGCIIGHDTVIADYSVIAPGAVLSGSVRIGPSCYIGAGSMVRQGLKVGERALVGMGAVVVREVAPGGAVVGNPARPLVRN